MERPRTPAPMITMRSSFELSKGAELVDAGFVLDRKSKFAVVLKLGG